MLGPALAVALNPYPVCREGCAGLCPGCGVNRNEDECTCTRSLDPRWGPLADIKEMMEAEQEGDTDGSPQET